MALGCLRDPSPLFNQQHSNLLRDQSLFIIFFWGGVKDFKGGDHMEFRGDIGGGGGQLLPTEYKVGTMEN